MRSYGGKTADERRAERRAQLIEAALSLFGTQGYAATSAAAVLRRANLKERYFAESFASMEELLAAVYDELHNATFPQNVGAIDRTVEPAEQFRQMINAIVSCVEADPGGARVTLIEAVGVGSIVEKCRGRSIRAYADEVAALLPEPPVGFTLDRRTLAMALVTGIEGILAGWITDTLDLNREQLVEHAVFLFLGVQYQLASDRAQFL